MLCVLRILSTHYTLDITLVSHFNTIMNQQEAIGYIQDILPQISHSDEAEDVLLKFANDKNLSPAQVERLGQVFNNAKTLTFLEKSANRGGSFPIIDTENLVSRYTDLPEKRVEQHTGRSDAVIEWCGDDHDKSASAEGELDSFPGLEDLKAREPAYTLTPDDQTTKEAAELDKHKTFIRKRAAEDNTRIDAEFLDMFEDEQRDTIREKVAGLVDDVRGFDFDWDNSIKAAAYLLGPDRYTQAGSILKSASGNKLSVPELDFDALSEEYGFNVEPRSTEEVISLHTKLASILDSFELLRIAREDRSSILGLSKAAMNVDEEVYTDTATNTGGSSDPGYNPTTDSSGRKTNNTNQNRKGNDRPSDRQQNTKNDSEKKEKDDSGKKEKGESNKSMLDPILDEMVNVGKGVGEKAGPSNAFKSVKSLIEGARSPNKTQKAVDVGLSDSAAQVSLTKALRDPIIAEADPETVVSLFNSMRSANPGFVEDPNNLIMAMREAVQYDSIPIHTLKELLDMNLSRAKVDDLDTKANQSRYSNAPRKV